MVGVLAYLRFGDDRDHGIYFWETWLFWMFWILLNLFKPPNRETLLFVGRPLLDLLGFCVIGFLGGLDPFWVLGI